MALQLSSLNRLKVSLIDFLNKASLIVLLMLASQPKIGGRDSAVGSKACNLNSCSVAGLDYWYRGVYSSELTWVQTLFLYGSSCGSNV